MIGLYRDFVSFLQNWWTNILFSRKLRKMGVRNVNYISTDLVDKLANDLDAGEKSKHDID